MLTAAEVGRAREIADAIDRELGLREGSRPWHEQRWIDEPVARPTLQIDDVTAIPFLDDIVGVEFYQLRARVRARSGDVLAATCPELEDYERYNRDRLGLGAPQFLCAAANGSPAAVAEACRSGAAFARLVETARRAGGLAVHPYMGARPVWDLARDVAAAARVPTRVLAPPPPVMTYANDKQHVTEVVTLLAEDLLDGPAVVPTRVGRSARELAEALRELAADHDQVGLKKTRCASAMGNAVFEAAAVLAEPQPELVARVQRFLDDKESVEREEVLAVAWLDTDISPSTQLWLPPVGPPVVEGVYEQLLEGPERVFWGSRPSTLGPELDGWLTRTSLLIATVYQHLGYVGRCSFDFIVRDGAAYVVECNGRWGGTSTPMHLVDRLFPGGRPPYRARDFVSPSLVGASFADLERRLGDLVYDPHDGEGRFVFYNVGCLTPYGKLDVVALGADLDDADRALEVLLPRALEG